MWDNSAWHHPTMNDEAFVAEVTERLAGLPGIAAASLGGSQALGTHRADSDWDFAVYYRGRFDPQNLRDLGWPGEVFEVGAWGGVFNSGAWLTIDGRRCDVHYRDLAVVEHELDEAAAGRFRIELLLFHLAGIPTYLVVAELALHRVLSGELPRPTYPARLRGEAHRVWWERAELSFAYAEQHHANAGRLTSCVGLLAQATTQAAHAVLAGRGQWITNEKALLATAGLADVDAMVATVDRDPAALVALVRSIRERCAVEVQDAGARNDATGER